MNFLLQDQRRRLLLFAPDQVEGTPSGGHAPDAMLPANKDTANLPGAGGQSAERTMPSQADIAQLAQQYWEEEGRPDGRARDHWERAERTLRQQADLG